jgi:mono/diheme cytochrome c family protein
MRSDDPTTLIRVILQGARSVATKDEPTGPGMPSFAWQLTDEQVGAVLTYIRNSWGSAAPAVSAGTVSNLRKDLAHRVQ